MRLKKEVRAALLLVVAVLFSLSALSQAPDVSITLSMNTKIVNPGDSVQFTARSYISNILVLSVPMRLEVVDPEGIVYDVAMTGHTNGDYRGSFKPEMPGTYEVKVIVTLDGEQNSITDSFELLSDSLAFNISMRDIYYTYGPATINGSISLLDEGKHIKGPVEIYVASQSSPFYQPLCNVECKSPCDFSCTITQNIEIGEYYILGKIKYENQYHVSRDTFDILMEQTEGLVLNLSMKDVIAKNESMLIKLNAEYMGVPLDKAIATVRITSPSGEIDAVLDQAAAGVYTYMFYPETEGYHSLDVTIVRGDAYGAISRNLSVTEPIKVIAPASYGIYDDNLGQSYALIPVNCSIGDQFIVDKLDISKDIDYENLYLIHGHARKDVNITPDGITCLLDGLLYLEAKLNRAGVPADVETRLVQNRLYLNTTVPRVVVQLPEGAIVKAVLDGQFKESVYAVTGMELILYSETEDVLVLLKLLHSMSLAINHTFIIYNGSLVPYAESIRNVSYINESLEIYSHDYVTINRTSISREVIQGLDNALEIDYWSWEPVNITAWIYGPDRSIHSILYEPAHFIIANSSPIGPYTMLIDAVNGQGIIDTDVIRFMVHSSEPLVTLDGNRSGFAMRNSKVVFKHKVTNNNYLSSDTLQLHAASASSHVVLYDSNNQQLTDTDRDGVLDTGKLGPGESFDFLVEIIIPPNMAVGQVEVVELTAFSATDNSAYDAVFDKVEIIPLVELPDEDESDIAIVSVDELDRFLVSSIVNNDRTYRFLRLYVEQSGSDGSKQSVQDVYIGPSQTQRITVPKVNSMHTAYFEVRNVTGGAYFDADLSNNKRSYHVNYSWFNDTYTYRMLFPYKETLGVDHELFTVKLYADIGDYDLDTLRAIGFDGQEGEVAILDIDDSQILLLVRFRDVKAGSGGIGHLYLGGSGSPRFEPDQVIKKIVTNGRWVKDNQLTGYYGSDYLHDLKIGKGLKSVEFHPEADHDNYELFEYHPAYSSLSSKVPVLVYGADDLGYFEINEQINGQMWNFMGLYTMNSSSYISIETFGTEELVVADAIKIRRVSFYSTVLEEGFLNGSLPEPETGVNEANYTVSYNGSLTIDLSLHLNYLTYISYNSSEEIDIRLNESSVLLQPVQNSSQVILIDFNNPYETFRAVIVLVNSTSEFTEEEAEHLAVPVQKIRINEPVRWKLDVDKESSEVVLPFEAENVTVLDSRRVNVERTVLIGKQKVNLSDLKDLDRVDKLKEQLDVLKKQSENASIFRKAGTVLKTMSLEQEISSISVKKFNKTEKKTILVPEPEAYLVEYETPAPMLSESPILTKPGSLEKQVKIYSNVSMHYHNVLSYADIPESLPEQVSLYWLINGTRTNVMDDPRFNVTLIDTDGDGMIDMLEWTTPRLSEQDFVIEIDLTILNVESKPTLFGNWTVYFNTTGTSNLTIEAVNGTTWAEFLTDDTFSYNDLVFLELRCGETDMKDGLAVELDDGSRTDYNDITTMDRLSVVKLVYHDWQCNETAYLTDQIITTGHHYLEFRFDDEVGYAQNMGYLLFDSFEDDANQSSPPFWVDYDNARTVVDRFKVFDNGTNSFYRGNDSVSGGTLYVSEYNETSAFSWRNYEVLVKMRLTEDHGTQANGLYFYSHYGPDDDYMRITSASGTYQFETNPGFRLGTFNSNIVPVVGDWYYMRVRVTSTVPNPTIKARIWNANFSEPNSGWNISASAGGGPRTDGTVGLFVQDSVSDFDIIMLENMSAPPAITIVQPNETQYDVNEMVWFNITLDKTGLRCNMSVDGSSYNLTKLNYTDFTYNMTFGSYGPRTVDIYCIDNFNNTGYNSVSFDVGSGRITITSPANETTSDYTPLLNAVFNDTYDTWYRIDFGANSSTYAAVDNLTLELGVMDQGQHTIEVFVNDSGSIESAYVSFYIDVPTPAPSFWIDFGDPTYTPDVLVDLYLYDAYIYEYSFSCNKLAWSSWLPASGSNPSIYPDFNITDPALGCNSSLGMKWVYAYARNYFNESSSMLNDTIIWDPSTLAGDYFYDNFNTTLYVNDSANIRHNTSANGGIELNMTCADYPFEAGCWHYSRTITLTETDGLDHVGYSFDVGFDTRAEVAAGKIQGDCSDFRATWYNKSSGTQQQVYFWTEEGYCNSSKTKIWLKAPELGSMDTETFYLYYGNPTAGASAFEDGDSVFDFFDDFSAWDASKWNAAGGATPGDGYWYSGEGTLDYWTRSVNYPSLVTDNDYVNGTMYWRLQTHQTDNEFDGGVGIREPDLDTSPEGYYFLLDVNDASDNGIVRDGTVNPSLAEWSTTTPQSLWTRSRAVFDGISFSFYNDYHASTITATHSLRTDGGIVLFANTDTNVRNATIDWLAYLSRTEESHMATIGNQEVIYETNGNLTSIVIKPAGIESWNLLSVIHSIPDGTNITYSVLDESDNMLCSYIVADSIDEYDLSGCAYGLDRIKVRADLSTTNSSLTPALDEWEVSWVIDSDLTIHEPVEIYQDRFTNFFMNGSIVSKVNNCNVSIYGQYKLVGQGYSFVEDEYSDFVTYTAMDDVEITDSIRLLPSTTTNSWYDYRWPSRQKYSVQLSETRYDYPIKINMSSSEFDFSETNSFQNIRMTYLNSTTNVETLLDHWVEYDDATDAVVWVNMPLLQAGTPVNVFIYYGYNGASDVSDGDSVFQFFDDFEDASLDTNKWQDNEGSYALSGGEFVGQNGNEQEFVFSKEFSVQSGMTVEFTMRSSINNPGNTWEAGVGIGTWNFLDDQNCGYCNAIDTNRWSAAEDASGTSRLNEDLHHNYRIQVEDSWSAFWDDTQSRFANASGAAFGPIYLTNDGDADADCDSIYDWILVRESGHNAQFTAQEQENATFELRGNYTSSSFDTGSASIFYDKIKFTVSEPAGSNIDVYTRTSHDNSYWTSWKKQTDDEYITSAGRRYIQYYLDLNTSMANVTPSLSFIEIDYKTASPHYTDMSFTDSYFGANNPYECGNLDIDDVCLPIWNAVTPKERGKYLLRLRAESETDCITETSNEKTIYVFADTVISGFDTDIDPAAQGDTITFTGNLADDLGDDLSDMEISIFEGTTLLGRATTNSNGDFSLSYDLASNYSTGIHTYTAEFYKNYDFYYNPDSASTNMRVSSTPVIHNLTFSPDPAGNSEHVYIFSSISDEVGIASVTYQIIDPESNTYSYIASSDGFGNYTLEFNSTWTVGSYQVTVVANNTDGISSSFSDVFSVEIDGSAYVRTDKDEYVNLENVYLQGGNNWWDQSWNFRQPVTVAMPSIVAPENYQVKLELTSSSVGDSFVWSNNCSDIRFVNATQDGSLSYWIEDCDTGSQSATVWVEVDQNITTNGYTFYMYYGNSMASSESNGSATFLLFDDFESYGGTADGIIPPAWTDFRSGDVRLDTNGTDRVLLKTNVNDPNGGWISLSESVNGFEAWWNSNRINTLGGDQNRYSLGVHDGSNPWSDSYGPRITNYGTSAQFAIEERTGGSGIADIASTTVDVNQNRWYKFYFNYWQQDMEFRLYDSAGAQLKNISGSDPSKNIFDTFFIHGGYEYWTDDIVVKKWVGEDPTVSMGDEEFRRSGVSNAGQKNIKGYRWGIVQRWTGSAWQDINPAIINDYSTSSLKTITRGSILNFQSSWNASPWNTSQYDPGWYRVKIALVDNSTSPQSSSSVIVDNYGQRLEFFYNFTIKQSQLVLTDLDHEHLNAYGLFEYESTDIIDWINVTVQALNNSAFNSNVTVTLLDELGSGYVGFGPENEMKNYGTIYLNEQKEQTWDNASNGYYIPTGIVSGTYALNWQIDMVTDNGPDSVNDTEYIQVHNMPTNFSRTSLARLYTGEWIMLNFSMSNLWSENLTNVIIKLNCPVALGLACNNTVSGTNIYSTTDVSSLSKVTATFNISALITANSDDYRINFTLNYTNPANENKSWFEIKPGTLEIRDRGILEIVDFYHDLTVTRTNNAIFQVFANNTNGTSPASDPWLNYSSVPNEWTNISGGLYRTVPVLASGDILWNNVTFLVGASAELGTQILTLNTSSPDIKPDFKELEIDVYANTSVVSFTSNDTNSSRGEVIVLSGYHLWDNSTPMSGRTVYFYDETDNRIIASDVTDASGYSEVTYSIDGTVSLGLHLLNVTYRGSQVIFTNPSWSKTYIDVGLRPTINSVNDAPDPVGFGHNVTLTANITDDDSIDHVFAHVTYPGSAGSSDINLTPVGADIYQANFSDTWFNGTYSYYIWANDTTGSQRKSSTKTFTLEVAGELSVVVEPDAYNQFENVTMKKSDTWWNASWPFRQFYNVSVGSGSTPDGYQLNVMLSSGSVGSNFVWTNECEDLRFISNDDQTVLDYWIEDCDSGAKTASIWVKYDAEINSTINRLYMYYGNSAASSMSNATEVFLLYEDFESYSGLGDDEWPPTWTEYRSGDTTLETDTGNRVIWKSGNNDPNGGYIDFTETVSDVYVSFWSKRINNNGGTQNRYSVGITSGAYTQSYGPRIDGFDALNNMIIEERANNGGVSSVVTSAISLSSNTWFRWDYWNYGNTHNFTVYNTDGDALLSIAGTDGTYNTFNKFFIHGGWEFYTDDIIARKYVNPEPTLSRNPEEEISLSYSVPDIKAYLMAKVQRQDGASWDDVATHIDDLSGSNIRTTQNGYLNLSMIWNQDPWNTDVEPEGTYRVYMYLVNPYGDILQSVDGPLEAFDIFTIEPPAVNLSINTIRIYDVNSTSRYSAAPLLYSGLNQSFTLFINHSYRIEIETRNNPGSVDWNLSLVNVSHAGLSPDWYIDESVDTWYKIGSGSKRYGANISAGDVVWNTTENGGVAAENTLVTFYYVFNLTENTTGDYPVRLDIFDPTFSKGDSSLYHVTVEQIDAPQLYDGIYNMTETEVIRVLGSTVIYARWDQEIDEATVYYNATIPAIISSGISLPSPNDANWTNRTFTPSSSWLLGHHIAQIRAKNPSDVWNSTLEFLDFYVYGLAYISDITLNETTIGIGDSVFINCGIEDDTKDIPIAGYNVSLYSNGALINWSLTNSSGEIGFVYTPPTYGLYSITCNISEQGWYKTDGRYTDSDTIFILEFEAPKYQDVSGPSFAHKGDMVTLSARWTDNAALVRALLETNASGAMSNVTSLALAGNESWANFSYAIPNSMTPGTLGWYQHANDTSGNYNSTPLQSMEVWGWSRISFASVNPGSVQLGNYTTATCRALDVNSNAGIAGYNVSYYRDSTFIGWNLTNATGYATYTFNNTPLGLHDIICNITDDATLMYNITANNELNDTLFVTLSPDVTAPTLLEYGINVTSLRVGRCLMLYGQWDEQINFSRAEFNMTSAMTSLPINPPYPNDWTNKSICTNASWTMGNHIIRLWANDSVGNINDTVSYLAFNLTSRSRVAMESPIGNLSRGLTNFTCNVTDTYNNAGIQGYLVELYGPGGFISSSYTNATGNVKILHDTTAYPVGSNYFYCHISNFGFYTTQTANSGKTLYLYGQLSASITRPPYLGRLYKGQDYTLEATVIDDNLSSVTVTIASWNQSSGYIASGNPASWSVPDNQSSGLVNLSVEAAKSYYYNDTAQTTAEIWSYVTLNQSMMTAHTIIAGQNTTMSCQVTDYNFTYAQPGVTVSFSSPTYPALGSAVTDSNGWASLEFTYMSGASENVSCIISDQQFFNASGTTELEEELNVSVAMSIDSIISPVPGCTYMDLMEMVVSITAPASGANNVNVTLEIDGSWNETQMFNFSGLQNRLINFTKLLSIPKTYNLTVIVGSGGQEGDRETILLSKYNLNISARSRTLQIEEDFFNVTYGVENHENCSLGISLYALVPNGLTITWMSLAQNDTILTSMGRSVWWDVPVAGLSQSEIICQVQGTADYPVTDILLGLDPPLR